MDMEKLIIRIERRGENHLYQLLQRYALNFTAGGGTIPNRFTIHCPDDYIKTRIIEGLCKYRYSLQ